jgi:hypothetical protein
MWQERTAYSQYLQQEAIGTRMRRWERPIHDFLAPYFRGLIERTTDTPVISAEVEHRRDLDTLTDMLAYLRSLKMAGEELKHQVPPRPQHIYPAHAGEGHPASQCTRCCSCDFILRSLPHSPLATYICLAHAKAARPALHSGVPTWNSPLRRPGDTSFPTSTSTYGTPPHTVVHGRLARAAARGSSSMQIYMFRPGALEGSSSRPVPDSALTPGASMTHCPTQSWGITPVIFYPKIVSNIPIVAARILTCRRVGKGVLQPSTMTSGTPGTKLGLKSPDVV